MAVAGRVSAARPGGGRAKGRLGFPRRPSDCAVCPGGDEPVVGGSTRRRCWRR